MADFYVMKAPAKTSIIVESKGLSYSELVRCGAGAKTSQGG